MKSGRGSSPTLKKGSAVNSSKLFQSRATAPITLVTDFGSADYFVGSVKGVILSFNPSAKIVDITHDIPAQDIETAAFTLLVSYRSFAPGTIHLAVVDPGVGSARRPIIVLAAQQCFVGPDNGIFSYVLDGEPDHTVIHVTDDKCFRRPLSSTFHGRDVFAPVVAALSQNVSPNSFGPQIKDVVRLTPLQPGPLKNGKVECRIIHIDHFGNCVTNIDRTTIGKKALENARILVGGKKISAVREFYSAENKSKRLFMLWGSAGFLEISAQNCSAAKLIGAKRGDRVIVELE